MLNYNLLVPLRHTPLLLIVMVDPPTALTSSPHTAGWITLTICLASWFRSHKTCPMCRFDIDPESLTLRMLPPTNRVGNGPGMMRARNAGREEVHLRGFSMRSWVLRLVCVVFANRWLTGFAAMHTLVQGPTLTGPALNTKPGTMPTN